MRLSWFPCTPGLVHRRVLLLSLRELRPGHVYPIGWHRTEIIPGSESRASVTGNRL